MTLHKVLVYVDGYKDKNKVANLTLYSLNCCCWFNLKMQNTNFPVLFYHSDTIIPAREVVNSSRVFQTIWGGVCLKEK